MQASTFVALQSHMMIPSIGQQRIKQHSNAHTESKKTGANNSNKTQCESREATWQEVHIQPTGMILPYGLR